MNTKPCACCGSPVPVGYLLCAPCIRENTRRFLQTHPAVKRAI